MDNKYIITPDGNFVSEEELYHWGIKGMKWGVRRYQNEDGSLTSAGRKRYSNPDGTLNKKGEKYIAKETARLAAEKIKLENQKKTEARLVKLDKAREENQKLKDQISGKNTDEAEENDSRTKTKVSPVESYDMSLLTDKELSDTRNRLQTEDQLKDLLTKRGYNVSLDPKTEVDQLIESLSKEKKLKELQKEIDRLSAGKTEVEKRIEILTQKRDIAKLEKEIRDNTPKKESKLSKIMNSQAGQNIFGQIIKSGENVAKDYIKAKFSASKETADKAVDTVTEDLSKTLGKEAEKVVKSVEKQQAKRAAAESKQVAKELDKLVTKASKQSSNYDRKRYEEKVDSLLSEMDDLAWETYYEKYANK